MVELSAGPAPVAVSSRWIEAQRVAFGCTLLSLLPPTAELEQREAQVYGHLWDDIRAPTGAARAAYLAKLSLLPLAALEALIATKGGMFWDEHLPLWIEARSALSAAGPRGISLIAASRIIADRMLNRALSAPQILRLARLELGREWPQSAERDIETLMRGLQADRHRVQSIEEFAKTHALGRWELIENDLLQREYAWPLVVVERADGQLVEGALPIGVEVIFDGPRTMPTVSRLATENLIDCSDWVAAAGKALYAAKELWEYKHTSWDPRFIAQIKQAKLVLDLRIAEQIVKPYRDWFRFELTDDSLGAYLATCIFCRFFNHGAADTVCATGALGREKKDPTGRGGDHRIRPVDGVEQKINYAERAFFFDQVIVPSNDREPTVFRPRLRVNRGAMLSHYVDHAAGQIWRKHRYVRCPDLYIAFKRYPIDSRRRRPISPTPSDQAEIDAVCKQLKASNTPVLELKSPIKAENVAAALYEISTRASDYGQDNENLASYAVVRAVEGEGSDRFWRVVWDAIEADDREYNKFSLASSPAKAGSVLATQLNWFLPTRERPRRAPDLLVIVGHNRLPPLAGIPGGPLARLHLNRLRATLNERLFPTRKKDALLKLIGKTRILLVPEEPRIPAKLSEAAFALLSADKYAALQALSIFRHGFTREMARRLLEADDDDFARIFGDILKLEDGPERVVQHAEASGEFYLTRRTQLPIDREELAKLHYRAANAIVGFLEPERRGHRLDIGMGFTARWRHEAQWHLGQAARASNGYERAKYDSAQERLNRIAQPFSWSRLHWAVRESHEEGLDTWNTVKAHMEARPPESLYPLDLVWVAKFADKLERGRQKDGQEFGTAKIEYLHRAMANCGRRPRDELAACRFVVATSWATMLMNSISDHGRLAQALRTSRAAAGDSDIIADAVDLTEIGKEHIAGALEICDPGWFDFRGDAETKAFLAAPLYRLGFWNDRLHGAAGLRTQSLVRWLGALSEAGIPLGEDDRMSIQRLGDGPRDWFKRHRVSPPDGLCDLRHVRNRWQLGGRELARIWNEGTR